MTAALEAESLRAWYGPSVVVRGLDIALQRGETLALLGRNGAGKTTTLRALMGLHAGRSGTVRLFGRNLADLRPDGVARAGMTLVLEDRGVFRSLTVAECLRIGHRGSHAWSLARVLETFPRLRERQSIRCVHLSGGEQQMLAIGRALLLGPRVLLLDEPTQGLAPAVVAELLAILQGLKREGLSLLLVEQNFAFATALADTALLLGKGTAIWGGPTATLREDPAKTRHLLGV